MASHDSKVTQRATENITDYPWNSSYYGNGPEFSGDYWSGFYGQSFLYPPYFLDSYRRGEAVSFYLNERQLKVIRDRSRRLIAENEFAISAVENRVNYVVGSGYTFRVLPLHQSVKDETIKLVQAIIQISADANQYSLRMAELVRRVDRDGEAFIRLFPHDSGLLQLRWVEPEHVRSPEGDTNPAKSFGIVTSPTDTEDVRGYYIVADPNTNPTPTFVPASEIIHVKMNTDGTAKRGLPLLYAVEANLRRAESLLASMSSTVDAQSKVVFIRKLDGPGRAAADRMLTELKDTTVYDPSTGGPVNAEGLKRGSILNSSKTVDYEWPQFSNSQSGIDVLKAELRAVASRIIMPESMLSADVSGGPNSAQLAAEPHAIRNFERLQRFYQNLWAESRAPGHEAIIWRQIAHAVRKGLLDRDVFTSIRIVAQAPAIIPRDPDKSAAAYKTYFDMGVVSPQQVASELGYDYEQMQKEREDAGLPDLQSLNAATMGGMPGDLGTTVPNQAGAPGGDGTEQPDNAGPGESTGDGGYNFDSSVFD